MCKKCRNQKQQKILVETKEEVYPFTNQPMFRPEIHYGRVVISVLSVLVVIGLLTWAALWGISYLEWYQMILMSYETQFTLLYLVLLLIAAFVFAKQIIIFVLRLYQRYMPYDIRCNCLFVPNCSEYMVLAIEKYGVCKGVKMGINRMLRCHEPNGGEDYP